MADPRPLIVAALVTLTLSCVNSEVTPIGTTYPSRAPGCTVNVFPSTRPDYDYVDVASARAKCHFTYGRSACIDQLKEDACKAGGDTVYAFNEGVMGEFTMISATLARKTKTKKVAAPVAEPAAVPASAPSDGCDPPCSPGFACKAGVCAPVCNPACEKGETCTRKRVCEPTPTGI